MNIDYTENTTYLSVLEFYTLQGEITQNNTKDLLIQRFKQKWDVKQWTDGFFTEKYIADINIHWLKFDPPNASSFMILAVLYILIMFVGVVGNGLVIFMYCRCKTLRSPANTLIVNLAISDVLMLLKMPLFIYNCLHRGPALGDIACRIYGFIGGLSGTASIGTLAAISFDRYFVIKFPLKRFSSTRIYTCLVSSWINALSFSLVPLLNIGFGKYQYEGYLISCSFDYLTEDQAIKAYIIVFCFAAFVFPMFIIAFSYYKIVQVVSGRSTEVSGKTDSIRHVREEDKRKQEVKLAVIVLIVIFLWFFSWTPYTVVALLGISGQKHLITPLASMIPALFCKTTSAIDPYVYAISHPKFRQELWKLLGITKKNKNLKSERTVWATQSKNSLKFRSSDYSDDYVEEETVEIELRDVNIDESSSRQQFGDEERALKKQITQTSLLCLKPTFSNKASSFRKLSRRCNSLKRFEKVEEASN